MLSALEFYDTERRAKATAKDDGIREDARNMDNWTNADYMDFAERYADYVCDFEKRNNYVDARTEEQYANALSV